MERMIRAGIRLPLSLSSAMALAAGEFGFAPTTGAGLPRAVCIER
jgi:hypothetical protein